MKNSVWLRRTLRRTFAIRTPMASTSGHDYYATLRVVDTSKVVHLQQPLDRGIAVLAWIVQEFQVMVAPVVQSERLDAPDSPTGPDEQQQI